jgi:hypothetical protein
VKQLGGKTVAIPFWYSIHNVVLQQMLNDNGLTPVSKPANAQLAANEVNLLVLPPSDMPPALASKRIAGYIVAEPFNALAENLKVGRVQRFTGDVWRNHACCVVFMHEHDLNNRPEWSQKVVNAIVKAQQWTRDHRAEAARCCPRPAPTSTPARACGADQGPGACRRRPCRLHRQWCDPASAVGRKAHRLPAVPVPQLHRGTGQAPENTLIEGDNGFLAGLDPAQTARDLVDDRFVRNAIAAVGGPSVFGIADNFERSEELRSDAGMSYMPALGLAGLLALLLLWWAGVHCSARPTACQRAFRRRQPWPAWSSCWAGRGLRAYLGQPQAHPDRAAAGAADRCAAGLAGWQLPAPGGGDHAGVPVSADDLAAVVDAGGGDADGRG